ncbi:YwmB family TATA-box binding protein [Aneurinibacillus migulanus]|uniref:TATA-box binding n=1 Tax=Aneurinibacillus migulanus TaxID=47500 RepID=A0A1G8KP93_ANEMI|nr:YwmB family TATA-box binding protein [Aneurinibacillus migulanus]MED0892559.1 YwmB family TATA-box binding protein [Aneurinibacillus migulanus]MED1615027.1 YwmB family TATA-box binding protein [Aneurinibacillus migulanus]MED4730130.1 YwmB family TATA-box binding protein [Aneurinibacillus migulanus]SDI45223.1 TATA-box binding [Aneurinibacillus migulanus]GED15484.1 membrane protein [Aneurinibacillus migulanus]
MNTKETWKYTLFAACAAVMLLGLPMLAGTFSLPANASQKQTVELAVADMSALLMAVKETDASIQEIQARVKRENLRFQTEREAELFLQAIAKDSDIKAWTKEVKDGMRVYRATSRNEAGVEREIYVSLHTSGTKNEIMAGSALTLRGKENQVPVLKAMMESYLHIFANSSELPQIISCVRGKYNGKLENDLQKKKASQLLASLEGTMVESLEEETVLSYSAYSPLFHTVVETNQRTMNLQVAAHYDTYMQGTMITVGTPIITVEY